MDRDLMLSALKEAESELSLMDSRLEEMVKLEEERNMVFTMVTGMRMALGMGPYISSFKVVLDNNGGHKITIWKRCRMILEQSSPLSIEDLIDSLKGMGVALSGRKGKETVRSILQKKQYMFSRTEDGRYFLAKP